MKTVEETDFTFSQHFVLNLQFASTDDAAYDHAVSKRRLRLRGTLFHVHFKEFREQCLLFFKLKSRHVDRNLIVFYQRVRNALVTKFPLKVVFYSESLVPGTAQLTFPFMSL